MTFDAARPTASTATNGIEREVGDRDPGSAPELLIQTRKGTVKPRTRTQGAYATRLLTPGIHLGLGPAGTGKTYLAVAAAIAHYDAGTVERIILSRPVVEAGERLGFLPGDMKEKIDPYMRPIYDALGDFLPPKQLTSMIESKTIEIAPLAYMRGRTLRSAFVLLDEAQNATRMQMRMFLTRLGEGSIMAVTGDPTQIDLPRADDSGFAEAATVLAGVEGVSITRFTGTDVVRHPLVGRVITAYERAAG